MAVDAGTIFSEVRISLDKLTGDVNAVNTKLDQIVKKSDEVGKKSQGPFKKFFSFISKSGVASFIALGVVIAKVSKFLKESEAAARDAQEVYSKFDTVFESIQRSANETADTFAESFGVAGSTARELLSATGDLLVGMGATEEQALTLSSEVNTLAADLASFSNIQGGTARASAALTKALLGERESAKLLGIVIRETDVQQKLMEKGQKDLTGQALLLAKAQVTLELATEQSQKALGDYARTADSAANVEKKLLESNKNLKEQVGGSFLPIVTAVRRKLIDWADALARVLEESNKITEANKAIAEGTDTIAQNIFLLETQIKREREELEVLKQSGQLKESLIALAEEETNIIISGLEEELKLQERLQGIRDAGIKAKADGDAVAAAEADKQEQVLIAQIADTQFRIEVEKELQDQLFAIDQQANLAIETGQEFNAELEKQKALQGALNKLFDEQFRFAGAGVQGLITRYGEWLDVVLAFQATEERNDELLREREIQRESLTEIAIEGIEKEKEALESLISIYAGPLSNAVSSFSNLFTVGNTNEIQAIDAKIAALEKEGESTEDLEAKKKELLLENFRLNKATQLLNAGINTAAAIAAALPNIPLSVLVGIAGAAQIAAIAATEPPSFQTGGIALPQSGGQLVKVAENGSPELMLNSGASGQALLGQFADQITAKMGGNMTLVIQAGSEVILQKKIDNWFENNQVLVDVSTQLTGVK